MDNPEGIALNFQPLILLFLGKDNSFPDGKILKKKFV